MTIPDSAAHRLRLRALWLILGWLLVALVIYLSLRPEPAPLTMDVGDKLPHLLAYAVLMFWFANLYAPRGPRITYACGFVTLGIALEFVQQATGYRTFEVADMAADAVGVAVGWLFAPPRVPSVLKLVERIVWREPAR